jgi:GTP diphosphokinase / guanosine-3',5'-bis(diphosphate) 3'-diphosphatase
MLELSYGFKSSQRDTAIDFKAMEFAMEAHRDQKRKYTGEPYFTHLAQVVGLVSTVQFSPYILAIAWLHDCVEDCGVSLYEIGNKFGEQVKEGVYFLSDLEEGNRETRKRLACERLNKAHIWVQNIKVCDLISNTSSIVQHDPKFAKVYLKEKDDLLKVLTKADERLLKIAREYVITYGEV